MKHKKLIQVLSIIAIVLITKMLTNFVKYESDEEVIERKYGEIIKDFKSYCDSDLTSHSLEKLQNEINSKIKNEDFTGLLTVGVTIDKKFHNLFTKEGFETNGWSSSSTGSGSKIRLCSTKTNQGKTYRFLTYTETAVVKDKVIKLKLSLEKNKKDNNLTI